MRLPGLKAIQRSGRRLQAWFSNHALVLGYHRVAHAIQDPFRIYVSPDHFTEHMEVLGRSMRIVSLAHLTQTMQNGHIPDRKIVITFDDGYQDIIQHVKPILEKHELPATVFVITGLLGQVFWWDRLEAAISDRPLLAGQIADLIGLDSAIKVADGSSQNLLMPIYRKLKDAEPAELERVIAEIESRLSFGEPKNNYPARSMTIDETAQLATSRLIEVGSHSTSHPWLARLPLRMQHEEISKSKSDLEEIIGKPVVSFSYPNGSVSKNTALLVEQVGFHCACASTPSVVRKSNQLFQLPRLWVSDIGGDEFEHWLSCWGIR